PSSLLPLGCPPPSAPSPYTTLFRSHVYVFGYRPEDLIEQLRLGGTSDLVWDKTHFGPGDLTKPWGPAHESITFGVHIRSKADRKIGRAHVSARLRRGSVSTVPRRGVTRHPSAKPPCRSYALV